MHYGRVMNVGFRIFHAYNYHYNHSLSLLYKGKHVFTASTKFIAHISATFNLAHTALNFYNVYFHAYNITRFYRMTETYFINACKHRC